MAFDECTPGDADYAYAKRSLDLTEKWLDRCIARFEETECPHGYSQALFPIVQGCVYPDLRRRAAEQVASKEAPGNAIGGLAVGEPTETMYEMLELVNDILPKDKPRYLMGVGKPENLLEAIERGVDMFDCVLPTRNGRRAALHQAGCDEHAQRTLERYFSRWRRMVPRLSTALQQSLPAPLITTNEIWGCRSHPSTTWRSTSGWCKRLGSYHRWRLPGVEGRHMENVTRRL